MEVQTTVRNAELGDLVGLLREQHDVKYDVVVPATSLRADGGNIVVADGATVIDDDGVTLTDAVLRPTEVFDQGISNRLDIPRGYLRRCREQRTDLWDANVNGWLEQRPNVTHLVRGFRTDDPTEPGIARAFLSDRFKVIDHLDVLLAALDAARSIDAGITVAGADLSESRLRLKLAAPSIEAQAPALLRNYRSPFDGREGKDLPIVFAGIVISNSETGGGAFQIAPHLTVRVCNNGMTLNKHALRHVHLGGTLEHGVIDWSDETRQRNVELVASQTRDAVGAFLDTEFVERCIADIEERATEPVEHVERTIERVSTKLAYTPGEQDAILAAFVRSGDLSLGGVLGAITAAAQNVTDPDRAAHLEETAVLALDAV